MTSLGAVCGALVGFGVVIVWAGLRGVEFPRLASRSTKSKVERATLRLGLAVGAAVVVGPATRWPVGALWAALAGWGAPGLLAGTKGRSEAVGRIEAVAG